MPEVERLGLHKVRFSAGRMVGMSARRRSKQLCQWSYRWHRWFLSLDLFRQFALVATLSLAVTTTILGWWISGRISEGILQRSAESGALFMQSVLEPHIQALAEDRPLSHAELRELEAISSSYALRKHVLSIKIWKPDGTIAFASRKELIGRRFATDEIEPALRGEVLGYLNELDEDENAFERTLSVPLYEIYAPLYRRGGKGIIAVGEFYENAERLNNELFDAVRDNWLIVGTVGIGLMIVLFAIVYRGSQTIEQQKHDLEDRYARELRLHEHNAQLRGEMQSALRQTARIDHMIQRRLGAELHDGPAQLMAFVLLQLDEIEEELCDGDVDRAAARDTMAQVRAAVRDALGDLRAISAGLFLPFLKDGLDLREAIQAIVLAHERRTGGQIDLSFENVPGTATPDLVQAVARIVQEALTNAEKHAGDTSPAVVVQSSNGALEICIRDAGPGLAHPRSHDDSHPEKLGLAGIRYRTESLGGRMEFRSAPGKGTVVRCYLPHPSSSPDALPDRAFEPVK